MTLIVKVGYVDVSPLTLVLGAIVMTLMAVVLIVRIKSRKGSKLGNLTPLPGPMGLPLLGSVHIIGRFKKPLDAFSKLREEYGDIYGITLGTRQCVVISHMSHVKEALVSKCDDFENRPGFLRFDAVFRGDRNQSIAFCDWSEKQKTRRKIAHPFLLPRQTMHNGRRMDTIIMAELQGLVSSLSQHQNQDVELRPFLNLICAHVFYQFVCTKRFPDKDADFLKAVSSYNIVFRKMFEGFIIDVLPWLRIFSEHRLEELRVLAEDVWKVTDRIIKEHGETIDHAEPRDLVDLFLTHLKDSVASSGKGSNLTLTDVEVIIEDLIGGIPVVGNMWLWGMYLVAAFAEIQAKLREEVSTVTGNVRAPSLEDRGSMPLTEATVLEVLRIVVSPITPHVASKDTSIGGYKIPKDTLVMFNTFDMNMEPQLWTEPRKFLPQRFLNASGCVSKPDHFIPFGTGKRYCLGQVLVKSILFLGISTLVQNFEVALPDGFPEPDLNEIPGIIVNPREIRLAFKRLEAK